MYYEKVIKTFHRTTRANECCSNSYECTNEGESASSGEEVSVPQQHHRKEPESKIIFTNKLEVLRVSQSSAATPPPPPHH